MIIAEGWQIPLVDQIVTMMKSIQSVQSIIQYGSVIAPDSNFDFWSDIDLLIVLKDGTIGEFYPSTDWVTTLGSILAVEQYQNSNRTLIRVCFSDLRRVDFVFTTESALSTIGNWGANYLWKPVHVCYSKSSIVNSVLTQPVSRPDPPLISLEDFNQFVQRFWFRQVIAVSKVIRDDLLIALHLALESVQDCCTLGMLHRDRETGTSHHKTGGLGNILVSNLDGNRHPYSSTGILQSLVDSSMLFDNLAQQWNNTYQFQSEHVLDLIAKARASILDVE